MTQLMRHVSAIENPHITEEFITDIHHGDLTSAVDHLKIASRLWLDNQICIATLSAVDKFRNVVEINGSSIADIDLTKKLVICDMPTQQRLTPNFTYVIPTHNMRYDDRLVVLTKADPEHLLDYHIEPFAPEEGKLGSRISLKFYLGDCIAGTLYKINGGYEECLP